tara:strand:- start:926 stop:2023 length:1098 start_codon:yes stop_codon:yes gene_type:complete
MSSLLEEAIVDAKALKEAALKNAENVVLEKYSAEVKGALDTLLEQDLGTEEGDGNEELMEFAEEVPFAFQTEELDAPGPEEIIEIDFDALKQRLEEEDEGVAGDEMIDALGTADELALEEAAGSDYMTADADASARTSAIGSKEEEGDEEVAVTEEQDEELAISEEMLSDLIEELIVDMTPRPQGWSSVNSADNSIVQANNDAMAAAQAAHLEEEDIEEEVHTAPDVVSDAELYEIRTKVSKLKESTRELKTLLIESRNQLIQLNLENAKLVYQNKALNSASLNERQKTQIVEAVQSANSVEEAGMIFETIQNAVGSTSNGRNRPQTLREAVQRPTSLLINSKKNNTVTHDPTMGRMLRLAGLTK